MFCGVDLAVCKGLGFGAVRRVFFLSLKTAAHATFFKTSHV